jgi:hypothetical protein
METKSKKILYIITKLNEITSEATISNLCPTFLPIKESAGPNFGPEIVWDTISVFRHQNRKFS